MKNKILRFIAIFMILFFGTNILQTEKAKAGPVVQVVVFYAYVVTQIVNCWQGGGWVCTGQPASPPPSSSPQPAPTPTYGWSDISAYLQSITKEVSFDLTNLPSDMLASMPSCPPDSGQDFRIASAKYAGPNIYRATRVRMLAVNVKNTSRPYDSVFKTWQKGDLLFVRTSSGKIVEGLKWMSSWTHVGLVYDPQLLKTFESNPDGGVKQNVWDNRWDGSAFSRKQVKLSASTIASAVNQGVAAYSGKPYFNVSADKLSLPINWSDKHNTNSMYCSKLVYLIFKNYANLDLDSNRTSVRNVPLTLGLRETDVKDNGVVNESAWIGVSPDDVYGSKYLGPDQNYYGLVNLQYPILQ